MQNWYNEEKFRICERETLNIVSILLELLSLSNYIGLWSREINISIQ